MLRLACYQDADFGSGVVPVQGVSSFIKRSFDLVSFNPPYFAEYTEEEREEMQGQGISISWAGGLRGREVIDRFLFGKDYRGQLGKLLDPTHGAFLMCGLVENEPEEILERMRKTEYAPKWKLDGKVVETKECGIETLFCLKVLVDSHSQA